MSHVFLYIFYVYGLFCGNEDFYSNINAVTIYDIWLNKTSVHTMEYAAPAIADAMCANNI